MINWRILQGVAALIPSVFNNKIYLTSPEKKQYILLAAKDIMESYDELTINNEFELKIDSSYDSINKYQISIFIKSKELPKPDNWYEVKNFYEPSLGGIISKCNIQQGIIEGKFEAIFTTEEEFKDKISFIMPGMEHYKDCMEETQRVLNCEIFSKTKKYKPGHRYDNLNETRYYLCPVLSRKENNTNSELITNPDEYTEAYLYVNTLDSEVEKTISDVLNRRSFGNTKDSIKIGYTCSPMVDSGEVLQNDFSGNIQDYWDNFIDNAKEIYTAKEEFGFTWLTDIGVILDVFSYVNKDHTEIDMQWKNRIIPFLIEAVNYCIIYGWENPTLKYRQDMYISKDNSKEDNIQALKRIFINVLTSNDLNIVKSIYYTQLLDSFGINFNKVLEEAINYWKPNQLKNTFDDFLKYNFYFDIRNNSSSNISQQRSGVRGIDRKTVHDLYNETALTNIIIEIVRKASENYGIGVSEYSTINVGTKKDPKEYITCKITLQDINKYLKKEIPQELQEDILRYCFTKLTIIFDKNSKLE